MSRIKINDLIKEEIISKNEMGSVKGGKRIKDATKSKKNKITDTIIVEEPVVMMSYYDPPEDDWGDPIDPPDDDWE